MTRPVHPSLQMSDGFCCAHCGRPVNPPLAGSLHRNHCPYCLHSLHVDRNPGDRLSLCRAVMRPIALWQKDNGELCILHQCSRCGTIKTNRLACDDETAELRQNLEKILAERFL